MEIAGFLAAELAYGRVLQIEKSLNRLLGYMGKSPYEFVKNFGKPQRRQLHDFKHRFTSGSDISDLLILLKKVLNRFGNIENFFLRFYNSCDENIIPALSRFCDSFLKMHAKTHKGCISKGLSYLLPDPANGSACKRLNLFLRWMVRDDDVDTGLWKSIDKAKLIVPVDVHMGRLSRILGFNRQKAVSMRAALEITRGFAEIEPADPVRYDFALSRVGIIEGCNGKYELRCNDCELVEFCR